MTENDRRLIEDYLPIEAISAEASREKSVRKGHISTLHLWWARRPLVACRAAVYGALVPVSQFVPNGSSAEKRKSLGRANAAKFLKRLCRNSKDSEVERRSDIQNAIKDAQGHILSAHAQRLSDELADAKKHGGKAAWADDLAFTNDCVTVEDITSGRAPRPRVLDMFAGGGAIPLEALRLGCETYALDLNPVAHIIELCTVVYPQKYGQPDPTARGMIGPKNVKNETTWGGLADEVRYWANWVHQKVKTEIGDLYPLVPDPEYKSRQDEIQTGWLKTHDIDGVTPGYLTPLAYLWTRTVRCKNPSCGASVPLVRQTWLCKKRGRYVALNAIAPKNEKRVRFDVVEVPTQDGLAFDPEAFSKGGNAACPFCGTVADAEYVQEMGKSREVGSQLLCVVCRRRDKAGTVFISAESLPTRFLPTEDQIDARINRLSEGTGLTPPEELIATTRPSPNARGLTAPTRHGLLHFSDLFNRRQLLSLLTQCQAVLEATAALRDHGYDRERLRAIASYLAIMVDRMADRGSSLCRWDPSYTKTQSTFGRPALPFVWDYSETNPFGDASGDIAQAFEWILAVIAEVSSVIRSATVERGSAHKLALPEVSIDAVITDPPYYDNVPYADVSDFFYVWLKRSVGGLYPEHFATDLAPKKAEITALASRFAGDMAKASANYEDMMFLALNEANRVLKPGGALIMVYAHKTTLGWATLVDALRRSQFMVVEAWPLDTEFGGRLMAQESSALASSIFLVARKRNGSTVGNYEEEVRPELEEIVRERVETLWELGVSGADLVIACVGAGLRAFTRLARVEYANGEEVPAQRFLSEVETVVLESILARLSKEVAGTGNGERTSLAGLDAATRFYILWRYTYGAAELDAGEAIIFANGTHNELDGPHGLSAGVAPLVEKKKSKYRLHDFSERGGHEDLGKPRDGQSAPLVDALHRVLWLMENGPSELAGFLNDAQPNREQMRLVAQALAGPALKGGELADVSPTGELAALAKLTANWRSVIEDATVTVTEREARRAGQGTLFGKGDNR